MVKSLKLNKKGESGFEPAKKSIFWIFAGILITLLILAFVMVVVSYTNDLTSVPPKLKAELISLRFTNSPECFAYQDKETGRVYPGVIDLDKFSSDQLDQVCYSPDKKTGHYTYNFAFELENQPGKIIKTNNYFYHDEFTLSREVLVKDKSLFTKDVLKIYVQIKVP